MDYWNLRKAVSRLVPSKRLIVPPENFSYLVKEKGRKSNYRQFNLTSGKVESIRRDLNTEEMQSFLEVSLRAAYCPMPLNCDVWDGMLCPYRCRYCFADSFRASLYTSFFDNSKSLGLRKCKPEYFKTELDKLMRYRGTRVLERNELARAIGMEIPIRLGIRFEDFSPIEEKQGVSLELLRYLRTVNYPIMVNTKSDLIGTDAYVKELALNSGGAAVHITALSSDGRFNKIMEPAAPNFKRRVWAAKQLSDAGVRVVARIEPFMIFLNDERGMVDEWVGSMLEAGVRHVTFDTYSYSARVPGIRQGMEARGVDFERMYLLMSESQWLGSLILSTFMNHMRSEGFRCSTFDFGNVPDNDDAICCCVDNWFSGGFNMGNVLSAVRFIVSHYDLNKKEVTWDDFEQFVDHCGGWLSEGIRKIVYEAWNLRGNSAYFPDWARGVEACGTDSEGRLVWTFRDGEDFRYQLLERLL